MSPSQSPESGTDVDKMLEERGLRLAEDNFVDFKTDSPEHPRNWALWKKTYNVILVCFFEFWMTAISTSGTAASDTGGRQEYHISRTLGYFMFTTMYLLGQAIGSIVCSPISETFGRRTLYISAITIYCIFSAVIAAVPSDIAVYFGRFITGFAAAIPATVAFGSFEDMFKSETRIWIVYIYTLAGNCGLVLGPIYSAYVSTYAGWRWVFYVSTIVSGVGIFASMVLNESRVGYLLELKVKAIKKKTGNDTLKVPNKPKVTFSGFLQDSLFRPVTFLVTEPIVFTCSVLMTISYSLIYGLTEGITVVYSEFGFNESTTASLPFLALLVGLILNVIPRFYDQNLFSNYRRSGRTLTPESKVHSLVTACPALAIGLWIFAWTIPPMVPHVHWIGSMFGLALVGYATNDLAYMLFGYLTDSYGPYAASACSSLSLSRTIMAAVFPLFTYDMYTGLGGNISTSIFAAIATVFCITPILVLRYGSKIRQISRFAVSDQEEDKHDEEHGMKNEKHDREDASSLELVEKAALDDPSSSTGKLIDQRGSI